MSNTHPFLPGVEMQASGPEGEKISPIPKMFREEKLSRPGQHTRCFLA
jgi:hypothetical protein